MNDFLDRLDLELILMAYEKPDPTPLELELAQRLEDANTDLEELIDLLNKATLRIVELED